MDATQARETKLRVEPNLGSRLVRFLLDRRVVLVPFSLAVALVFWELVTRLGNFPAFILPSPGLVWVRWTRAPNGRPEELTVGCVADRSLLTGLRGYLNLRDNVLHSEWHEAEWLTRSENRAERPGYTLPPG